MESFAQFGLNPILLTAQIINFLVVFFVLKKFLYKPILDTLKNREKTIKDGLKQAEEARLLMENTAKKEAEILKKAQTEAKQLLEETRSQRDEMLKEAEAMTRTQTEAMLKEAREQISFETAAAEKRLSAHISQLATTFLQKSVSELFSDEDQDRIMKNAVKKLKEKTN